MNREVIEKAKADMEAPEHGNEERVPGKHTWRLNRRGVPGAEYKVVENFPGCTIDYGGLNAMLRGLGYKTSSWDPK